MKLLIAIPALNEEASIQRVIERCLEARREIIETSPVTAVDITVVSDGSTDRTVAYLATLSDRLRFLRQESRPSGRAECPGRDHHHASAWRRNGIP
jgi:glycosyltransferase involved in cell wall biosynthesis